LATEDRHLAKATGRDATYSLTLEWVNAGSPTSHVVLIVRLTNTSPTSQKMQLWTNVFEGEICLQSAGNGVRRFGDKSYIELLQVALIPRPYFDLAPGAGLHWQLRLAEQLELEGRRNSPKDFRLESLLSALDQELGSNCELWCELKVIPRMMSNDDVPVVAVVRSNKLRVRR